MSVLSHLKSLLTPEEFKEIQEGLTKKIHTIDKNLRNWIKNEIDFLENNLGSTPIEKIESHSMIKAYLKVLMIMNDLDS